MVGRTWALAAASMVAAAGLVWGLASLVYHDPVEAVWCSSFGVGFALVAIGILRARDPWWTTGGLVVAAVPSFHWAQGVAAIGRFDSSWFWFGVGIVGIALVALLRVVFRKGRVGAIMGVRILFAVAFLAALRMAVAALDHASVWMTAEVLAAFGLGTLIVAAGQLPLSTDR